MQRVVMPQMKALFQSFSPHAYAPMSCATCHGDRASRGDFEMPNPDLLLSVADAKAAYSAVPDAVSAFMVRDVQPAMARLLGRRVDDSASVGGGGCFDCHSRDR
jgi:mono/diheme cytochrome c family protein